VRALFEGVDGAGRAAAAICRHLGRRVEAPVVAMDRVRQVAVGD
jgi:hypothetical protein